MVDSNENNPDWRSSVDVLVPEANALGMIGVIRSLGRAGYRVHACASRADALGLQSNYAAAPVQCPAYDDSGFVEWLRNYVGAQGIRVIVPSEGFLHAIRDVFEEFSPLMPLSNDPDIVYRAFSKIDVEESLRAAPGLGYDEHSPPALVVRRDAARPTREQIEALPLPIYIKADAGYCTTGDDALLRRITAHDEVMPTLDRELENYQAILVQGFVPGVKAAAAFCLQDGEVLAKTEVLGLRTNPHTGGMMSLRQTTQNTPLAKAALAWLQHLEWEGVAMVECKSEPGTDRFWFIELNPRYWGYLHLDLFAGVDVPRIQVDHFLGHGDNKLPAQKPGVIARHTLPGDAGYLLSLLRDSDVPLLSKITGSIRFAMDFLRPDIHADLLFPGDRKLYWKQWAQYLKALGRH